MANFADQRRIMVESQVRTNDVTDTRIHAAMMAIPRERFVPESRRTVAYMDGCVPLGHHRMLADARSFAKMIQLAAIGPEDHVLDVGCGAGYSAAVLAWLADNVVAVEEEPLLAAAANETLVDLAIDNVLVVEGPLAAGHVACAPYDVIVIEGAAEQLPDALLAQLAPEGRLVCVFHARGSFAVRLYIRHENALSERAAFDAQLPILRGFEKQPSFIF